MPERPGTRQPDGAADVTAASPTAVAGRAAEPVLPVWHALLAAAPRVDPPPTPAADSGAGQVAPLPAAAARWLGAASGGRTDARARGLVLEMTGQIRLGPAWTPFRAVQVLVPGVGFAWVARAGRGPATLSGFDAYLHGQGRMRWALAGRVPVLSADDEDVSRSAVGRLAAESVFLPSSWGGLGWRETGEDSAAAAWEIDGQREEVELGVAEDGDLRWARMQRWGTPGRGPAGRYPFGVTIEDVDVLDGLRTPTRLRAGWWWGTPRWRSGEFFRARITRAERLR